MINIGDLKTHVIRFKPLRNITDHVSTVSTVIIKRMSWNVPTAIKTPNLLQYVKRY